MNYEGAGYVYAIRNRVNGHAYIGSTKGYKARWHTHRSALRRKVHHSFILQRAWDKHGEDAFEFKILLVCPLELRIFYETRLMALETYNVLRTPKEIGVRGGWTHSEEFKSKMSMLHKGKALSAEHKAKLSDAATGRVYSEAFRAQARARQRGVVPSEQTKTKLSAARTGYIVSLETRNKLARSAAQRSIVTAGISMDRIRSVQPLIEAGASVRCAIKSIGMSSATYYKYCTQLALQPKELV
jgi:group I intron endonuclease